MKISPLIWLPPLAAFSLCGCKSKPVCEDDVGAFVFAQEFVKRQLKAPSTAEFPNITADGVSSVPTKSPDGQCAFSVRLYVDAQNSFGAKVRQRFHVMVAPEKGGRDTWRLVDIEAF